MGLEKALGGQVSGVAAAGCPEHLSGRPGEMTATAATAEFLATLGHELRTPLGGMLGMIDLLQATPLDDQQRRWLGVLHGAAQGLLTWSDHQLAALSREEQRSEQRPLSPPVCVTLDIHDIICQTTELFTGQAQARGLALRWRIAADVPRHVAGNGLDVAGLEMGIRQVLTNLLGNALKFTTHGQVEVSVTRVTSAEMAHGLCVQVADSGIGIGIAPEQVSRIFEPHVQADASIRARFGGTGLGLGIVRDQVQRMGGTIRLESTPGEGSVFTFCLPLPAARAGQVATEIPDAPGPDIETVMPSGALLAGVRVLLVEDDAVNQEYLTGMLTGLGCLVQCVDNGQAAVEASGQEDFAIILMDCGLPLMDGWAAVREIRRREQEAAEGAWQQQRQRILALTAYTRPGEHERCLAAGMDGVLCKPVTLAVLRQQLAFWLDQPAVQPEAACPVFDAAPLEALRSLQQEAWPRLAARMRSLFLQKTAELVAELAEALRVADCEKVRQKAHQLTSSAAQLGALRLSALAAKLEVGYGWDHSWQPSVRAVELETEYRKASEAFLGYMKEFGHD